MSDRVADQSGISGSVFSSPQAKATVMDPKANDTYNEYWNMPIDQDAKSIPDMTIAEFFSKLLNVVRDVWAEVYQLWIKGVRDWTAYWEVITKDNRTIYLGIALIALAFLLYIFF